MEQQQRQSHSRKIRTWYQVVQSVMQSQQARLVRLRQQSLVVKVSLFSWLALLVVLLVLQLVLLVLP
jgi:hypothetical protein